MVRWVLVAILAIGIAGTAFWGYQEHQEKNAVLIQAENTYQRSFHELSYNIDLLHDKIGTTLAMNSEQRLSPQMVDIWRITSDALSNVGQLPLGLLPFNKTEEFLSNIGDFTYRTAVRDLDSNPLSDKEKGSLDDLYKQSGEIKDELRDVQHITLKNNLRWMDVQLALANQDDQMDNTIIDGLKTVEKKVDGYAETNGDSGIMETSTKDHKFKHLSGEKISEADALKKSKRLFHVKNDKNITVTKSGDGSDIPLYSISYRNNDENAYMDMTEKGGHPLTLLVDRPVQDKQISLNDGQEKAKAYLDDLDFENMTIFQSDEFDNIGVYSFLYDDDGVRVHSDGIEVKVALDNGDILGLTARDYFMNHTDRDIPKPDISKDEAADMVNPDVELQEDFLAVIDNDLGEEVLAYEFLGTLDNETYRIFINAMDGKEEKVEKLGGTEINFASNF